jgi:hypothetical protein
MVSTNEGAVSTSQLGTRHLFWEKLSYWLINQISLLNNTYFTNICVPLTTFCYFELCSIFLRKGLGRRKPSINPWNKHKHVGISTVSKPYWTVYYRIKWALQDVSELGYLFLTKSSLHIIAWDLDVRDHSCRSWMMTNSVTQ